MTREIKFRAWDEGKYRWCEKELLLDWEGDWMSKYGEHSKFITFQFFTGLKDKNGEHEIYEGDKVKTPAGFGVVEWRDGCFRICWNDTDSTTLHDTPQDMMEVIGNMYEN